MYWTLLDRAAKAGKPDLNGGTPARAVLFRPKVPEVDRSPPPRDFRFADGSVAVRVPVLRGNGGPCFARAEHSGHLARSRSSPLEEGVEVLREGLQRLAGWRLKAMGGWRRPKTLVIDIDSLPAEVHGEQPGSAWNGYYHRRVYHPVVAAAGETGDIPDLRLREGQVHTADGGLEFVLEVLERAERHLCGKAAVRFDAGYPGEPLMAALEERGTHHVARVRNNAVLKRLALPAMDAAVWDALSNGAPAGVTVRPSRGRTVVRIVLGGDW